MSYQVIYFTASLADAQLIHSVTEALAGLRRSEVRRLAIGARRGIVTLTGQVNRIYTKRAVLERVRQVAEVRIIIDNIRVGSHEVSWKVRRAASWLFALTTVLSNLPPSLAPSPDSGAVGASAASGASHPP